MKYIMPNWDAPTQVKAYTTLRGAFGERYRDKGGLSPEEDSKSLKTLLNLPEDPIWIKQIHSATVIEAKPSDTLMTADATYTRTINRVCVVLTSDCLPILISNTEGTEVAAIHAGWRGLANGIIEATLKALKTPSKDLLVWLGPAIGPEKFEVGKDVFDIFTQKNKATTPAFSLYKKEKWLANLYDLARIFLNLSGIYQIYGGDFCTYTQADLFFSYRRDQGKTGRMASIIWIEES